MTISQKQDAISGGAGESRQTSAVALGPAMARPGVSVPGRAAVPLQRYPESYFGPSSGMSGCSTSTVCACAAWARDFYGHEPSAGELAWYRWLIHGNDATSH